MKVNKAKLQTILGYAATFLAIAHDEGVTLGHFGSEDFVDLAQKASALLYSAIAPSAAPAPQPANQ
jgi:hypothetical protein